MRRRAGPGAAAGGAAPLCIKDVTKEFAIKDFGPGGKRVFGKFGPGGKRVFGKSGPGGK